MPSEVSIDKREDDGRSQIGPGASDFELGAHRERLTTANHFGTRALNRQITPN